jgi:PAS domain S-box-containing protein
MLGYRLEEIEGTQEMWKSLVHPEDVESVWKAIQDNLAGRNDLYKIEYRMRHKSGEYRWILDCGKIVMRDAAGLPIRASGTHRDITEEKRKAERIGNLVQEKELLVREAHHRVKNTMNTMKSLVSLQRRDVREASAIAALKDVESRFGAMMVLYEKLNDAGGYGAASLGRYLPALVEEIVGNFPNGRSVRLSCSLEEVALEPRMLQTLGIIVNELVTNIMKYAFEGVEGREIGLSGAVEGDRYSLSVRDNGKGMPEGIDFSSSPGFGLMLIAQLCRQIEAGIRLERGGGTRVILDFAWKAA